MSGSQVYTHTFSHVATHGEALGLYRGNWLATCGLGSGLFSSKGYLQLAVAHGRARMYGGSYGALDVAAVSQISSLLLHNDNMSNYCQATRRQKTYIASVRRYATIRMGSGGI
eukprot:47874-Amphidinium_carterae.1